MNAKVINNENEDKESGIIYFANFDSRVEIVKILSSEESVLCSSTHKVMKYGYIEFKERNKAEECQSF